MLRRTRTSLVFATLGVASLSAAACSSSSDSSSTSQPAGTSTTTVTTTGTSTGTGGSGQGGSTAGGSGQGGTATGGSGQGGTGGSGTGGTGGSGQGGAGGHGQPPTPVVDCPGAPLVPPASGTCEVKTPGKAGVVFRGTVLAPDQVLHRGEVFVAAGGTIACVDCDCSKEAGYADASIVECADGVISPGLINPHDHITFANNTPKGHGTERYDHRHEWRKGLDGHTKISVSSGASTAVVEFAELRFVMGGATSAASAGGKAGLLRNLDTAGLLEGLPVQVANSDTFPLGDSSGTMLESGCAYGGTPTTNAEIKTEDGYLPHISEGVNKAAENEFQCESSGANDLIEPQTAAIHSVGLTAKDMDEYRKNKTSVIWSPRSNVDLYGDTAQVTELDALGIQISLGTDWVPSGSMNLLRELKCADDLNQSYFGGHFDDAALWRMVTTNAAFAVGAEKAIGMLKKGYVADIAIFDGKTRKDHRAVVGANVDDVVLVLRGGQPLYGDDALVATDAIGGKTCETLDVCNRAKRACVAKDIPSTTLAAVRAAGEAIYPLFFCGQPDNEPSCVPYRSTYANGITADDKDGDGVKDADDDCPNVFNPIRPMNDGKQADFDGDGKGDVCDPCPVDANDGCAPTDANDIDGDGIPNGTDNCPDQANPNQEDADADGHGDVCDSCATPNPGATPCGTTIQAVRDPKDPHHPADGSTVTVSGVYVIGVRPLTGKSQGFWIQDAASQPYQGIFVFTGATSPTVVVGNRVTVSGTYTEYKTVSELGSPVVTIEDAGTKLPFNPIVVDPADIATGGAKAEGYESMLLEVDNVTITNQNPDAPADYDEFQVTGNLRIDDFASDGVTGSGLDNICPVGTVYTKIVGIGNSSASQQKLEPRGKDDFAGGGQVCMPFD
jgi:cytosine/adenosine deaminase-related metal-dependent hydrolase